MKKIFFPILIILYVSLTFMGCQWFEDDDPDVTGSHILGVIYSKIIDMPHPFSQVDTTKMKNDEIFLKGTVSPGGAVSPDGTSMEDRAYRYNRNNPSNNFIEVDFATPREEIGNGRMRFSQTLVSGQGGTIVPSGSVLIVGGITSKGVTNTAEFYNPELNKIYPLGNLNVARYGHTMTEIKNSGTPLDGQFLVVGGTGGGRRGETQLISTIELLDPMTGTFTTLNARLNIPREGHTATLLADGRILITGGMTGSGVTNTGEIFDPATRTFTLVPNAMSDERAFHTATYLDNKTPSDSTDDAVLIVGGQDASGFAHDSADFYNPVTGLFQPVGSVTQEPIYHHRAATLPVNSPHDAVLTGGMTKMPTFVNDSEVILSITNQVEVFDYTHTPSGPDGFFTKTRDMLAKRAMHSTDSIGTNTLVILGGVNESGVAHTQGEEYDF